MGEIEFLNRVLLNNRPAVELCGMLGRISQVFDDAVDGDKQVDLFDAARVLREALFDLHENFFYAEHKHDLAPLIRMAILDWETATEIEQSNSATLLPLAYTLRDSLVTVVLMCARLVGGDDHASDNALDIRAFFHDESLADYLKGLR